MTAQQARQRLDMAGRVVQCRNVAQLAAAMGPVQTGVADGDFLQRLQAVGGEARRDDVDIAQLLPAPFQQNGVPVRLKPWRTSKTALVADRPRFPFQPQSVNGKRGATPNARRYPRTDPGEVHTHCRSLARRCAQGRRGGAASNGGRLAMKRATSSPLAKDAASLSIFAEIARLMAGSFWADDRGGPAQTPAQATHDLALDEVYLKIAGRMVYLWRAVDAEGEVLDVLVQSRRNKRAALKLMRKLLKKYGFVPDKLVTDDLKSYAAAASELSLARRHERGQWRTTAPANRAVQGDILQFVCCLDKGLDFSEYFKFSFSISIAVRRGPVTRKMRSGFLTNKWRRSTMWTTQR
jgi:hypothetical protein